MLDAKARLLCSSYKGANQESGVLYGNHISQCHVPSQPPSTRPMTESKEKTERIHCNKCGHETKHLLLVTRSQYGSAPYDENCDISWETVYDVFECCGCEEVTLRRRFYFSEWNSGDVEIIYYPPRIGRLLPPWKDSLPDDVAALLEEVYTALQADSRRLVMMGARTLIDMIMLNEIGDVGSFAEKLKKLETEGFLSAKNSEVLNAALDVGHAASHRGYCPSGKHVQIVMDIVENLLQATILQKVADDLKKATPQRKRAQKKN